MKKIIKFILVVIILGVLWYLLSPLLINKEINEAVPKIPTVEEMADMTPEEAEETQEAIEEEFAQMPDIIMEDIMNEFQEQSVAVATGSFVGADNFHKGTGEVFLHDGFLRFEDLDVTNGPDLRVLLVKHPNPKDRDDLGEEGVGYFELAKLKGNVGNQNYDIPSDVDLSEYGSIVIYCKPFHVIFASATLN
jgi:hypothetical protein